MPDPSPRPISVALEATRPEEDDLAAADAALVALVDETRRADIALRSLLAEDRRDVDEIPGYDALADGLLARVDRVCETQAVGQSGLLAKAALARHFGHQEGDKASRLALSVVSDLLDIASGPQA